MRRLLLICALVAALACLNVLPAEALISLEFNPSDIEVPVCTTFYVDLLADISPDDAILGWGLDLVYDSTQMNWDSLIIGPLWNQVYGPDGDGLGGLAVFPPGGSIWGDDILLATMDFHCRAVGVSWLDLGATPSDFTEGFIKLDGTFAQWTSTPAKVTQTPEPASLFLIGTGLAGFAAARRRKKNR